MISPRFQRTLHPTLRILLSSGGPNCAFLELHTRSVRLSIVLLSRLKLTDSRCYPRRVSARNPEVDKKRLADLRYPVGYDPDPLKARCRPLMPLRTMNGLCNIELSQCTTQLPQGVGGTLYGAIAGSGPSNSNMIQSSSLSS